MLTIVILEKASETEQTLPNSQTSGASVKPRSTKSQIGLKKKIRQLQFSLDILDMETPSTHSFRDWFLNQFVMPYAFRIPETVKYLLTKLEMEDFAKDLNISLGEPTEKASKKKRKRVEVMELD